MTITTKRRPTVGDKVRLLRDLLHYKTGDIVFIMGDDHSFTPYYCKFADNSFHWLIERFVELVETVEPRHDPRVFGKAQVGVEPVLESEPDPLADLKAAWNAGSGVRPKGEKKYFYKCKYEEASPGKEWHPLYTPSHYEIEPVQATVDPLADVKAALKAGKRVRFLQDNNIWGDWRTAQHTWTFDHTHYRHARNRYEIEPDHIPEPKIEWILGDKYLTRGEETAVLVNFDKGTRLPNLLVVLGTGQDHWVTEDGKNFPGQTQPHTGDIVKHLKDKS